MGQMLKMETKLLFALKVSFVSSQELEREKHAHCVLQFQFTELKETLKQSEEYLNVSIPAAMWSCVKHGVEMEHSVN